MTRRDSDYYPTPPDAVEALRLWLDGSGMNLPRTWHEPCAGYGAIPRGLTGLCDLWVLNDIDSRFAEALEGIDDDATSRDALAAGCQAWPLPWPSPRSVIATNPPFSDLDAFMVRILDHVEDDQSTSIVLTRGQVMDEPGRLWLRKRRLPHFELRMAWRVDFKGNGKGDNASHVWWVYLPGQKPRVTRKLWLERPKVSQDAIDEHSRWSQLLQDAPLQQRLGGV